MVRRVLGNRWFLRGLLVAAVCGVWLYASRVAHVSPLLLPKISSVASSLKDLLTLESTWSNILVTIEEVAVGFAIAALAALALTLWANRTPARSQTVEALLAWAYMAPLAAFLPLFVLFFGIGIESKIAFGATAGFFPMSFTALRGVRTVDPRYATVARAFGASKMQEEWLVKLPACIPMLLAAVRIGAALTFICVILAELLAASRGLGALLSRSTTFLDTAQTYALIIVALVLAGIYQPVVNRLVNLGSTKR